MGVPRRTSAAPSRGIVGGSALLNQFRDLDDPFVEQVAAAAGRGFADFANDQPAPTPLPDFSPGGPSGAPAPVPAAPSRALPSPRTSGRTPGGGGLGQDSLFPRTSDRIANPFQLPLQQPGLGLFLPSAPISAGLGDFLDERFEQQRRTQQQLIEARNLGASNAAASYELELSILGREISNMTDAQAANSGLWAKWESGVNDTITESVRKTQAAYAEYIEMLNANFDAFDALNESRFNQYAEETKAMIQEWMDKTNGSYEDFKAQIPEFWQPAIDAIVEGNLTALGEIEENTAASKATIEGHLIEQSDILSTELDKIASNNPALHADLMREMIEDIDLGLERVAEEGRSTSALQDISAKIGKNVVETALASGLRDIEEQRLTVINDAARQRHTLVRASGEQLAAILESSGQTRAQMLVDIEGSLKATLNEFDKMRESLRLGAERGRENMAFSINDTLQQLFDSASRQTLNRDQSNAAFDLSLKHSLEELWGTQDSPIEIGGAYALGVAADAGLPGFAADDIVEQFLTAYQSREMDSLVDFQNFVSNQRNAVEFRDAARVEYTLALQGDNAFAITEAREALINAEGGVSELYTRYAPEFENGTMQNIFSALDLGFTSTQTPDRRPAWTGDYDPSQVTSFGEFGRFRNYYNNGQGGDHAGVDLNLAAGTPLTAVVSGHAQVVPNAGGAGNKVVIKGDDGLWYVYMHLDSFTLPEGGSRVTAGEQIGIVGTTGNSSAIHLHFEVRQGGERGTALDPMPYLFGKDPARERLSTAEQNYGGLEGLRRFSSDAVRRTRDRFSFIDQGSNKIGPQGLPSFVPEGAADQQAAQLEKESLFRRQPDLSNIGGSLYVPPAQKIGDAPSVGDILRNFGGLGSGGNAKNQGKKAPTRTRRTAKR